MKRKLWVTLAAVLMLAVLWCGAALADDYAFRTQPRNITLDPENETTLRWSLTFDQVRTKLVLSAHYYEGYSWEHNIPVKEIGSNSFHCTLTYEEALEALRKVPAGASYSWHLDAYVNENLPIRSDPINITLNPYAFTLQPSGGTLAPEGTLHLSWGTNFTPKEIRINYLKAPYIVSESRVVTVKTPAASATSADLSYGEVVTFLQDHADPDEDKWFIQAFYNDDQFVSSDYFSVPVEDLRFVLQPQGGTLESGQALTLNWATNFTPTWSEVVYAYGWTGSDFAHIAQVKELMNSGRTCDLSYNEVVAALSDIPYFYPAYSKWMVVSHYDYQSDLEVFSEPFDISFTGPQFTSLREEGYDPDRLKCTVTWDTNFIPNWWELENITTGERERLNDTGTGHNWYDLGTDTMGQKFRILAYYGNTADQYIASAEFSGGMDRLNFTVQPNDCWIGDGSTAEISWQTSFTPVSVELKCIRIRHVGTNHDNEMYSLEPDSCVLQGKWGNIAFQPLPREWVASSRSYAFDLYYLLVYYKEGEGEYVKSRTFLCQPGSPAFTSQPQNVLYQPGYGADVIYTSNFSPLKTRLAQVDAAGNPLPEDPEEPFTWYRTGEDGEIIAVFLDDGVDSCDFRVLLWYDLTENPVESDVFTVSRYAFTAQPASGYIQRRAGDEQHTPMYRVSWETSFEPVRIQICSVDEEGETEPEDVCAVLCPEATDKTFEIPMTETVGDLRSFRIRAYYGAGADDYISSEVFTVTDPLFISADPMVFVDEDEGGVLRFEANFIPDEARLCRLPLTAYNQLAAEGDVPTTEFVQVASFAPESSSMEYMIPYAAVADQDYVYRIRLHYSDGITSGWTEWQKPVRVYADRRNAPYGIKGDFTQWTTIGMTWNEQAQRYEFTAELDPETFWLWRGVFEFTVSFNGREYTADRTVFDSAAGLPMHEQTDVDDPNIYLAVSRKGLYTFTVNATNPNAPTLTVTNDLDSTDAFLMGFLGILPQRMVDPHMGEHGGGEEDVNPPFEPYIFPSGRTLWASARISGGEWLEDLSGFCIGENGKQYGCSAVREEEVLSLTEGQTCPVWVNPGEDTVEYDFFYCPDTHQLVIRQHVTTYEIILTPCDIEEGLISLSWCSVEEDRHHLPNPFIVSPDAPYLPVNISVTVTAPQIPGYSFSCWYEGQANESSYFLYEEEPLSHSQTYTFNMSDFCRKVNLLAMYTRTGAVVWTVAFDTQGGTAIPDSSVEEGEIVERPADPLKIGAYFGGWYTDADCTEGNLFSFDTPTEENDTLFAKWVTPDPAGILNLPAALTAIEADAFHGVSAEAVIIPKTVTAIEGDAFAGGSVRYIYGFNSLAREFASANDYTFILIDDAWMASRTEKGGEGD